MTNETKIDELIAQANAQAVELQQLISNYKKSPKERLTEEYVKGSLSKIDASWTKFQRLDHNLRCELPETHAYFNKNIYGQLGEMHNNIRIRMETELSFLKKDTNSSTSKEIPGTSASAGQQKCIPQQKSIESVRQQKLIDNVYTLIEQAQSSQTQPLQFYSMKLVAIQQHWKNINNLHEKLLASSDLYDLDQFFNDEEKINEGILELQERIMKLTHDQTEVTPTAKNVKLPAVELPKFDGSSLKWRQFRDLFLELVHDQPIPDCQKMWYLKTSLKGEADQLLQHLSPTAENYNTGWKMLEDRYENRRLLINAVLTRLVNQASITAENVNAIKGLHDTTQECLLSLKNLQIDTDEWSPIVLFLLTQKLSKNLHTQWETSLQNPRALAKIAEFLDFLRVRFQSLENLNARHVTPAADHERKTTHYKSFSVTAAANHCIVCKQDHALYKCQEFLRLSPKQRLNLVQQVNCCVNCLKKGHKSKTCVSSCCLKCKKKHNTLLHLEGVEERVSVNAVSSTTKISEPVTKPVSLTTTQDPVGHSNTLLSTVRLMV